MGYPANIKELKEIKKESNTLFFSQCLNILNADGCHHPWCSDSKRIYIEKIRYKDMNMLENHHFEIFVFCHSLFCIMKVRNMLLKSNDAFCTNLSHLFYTDMACFM